MKVGVYSGVFDPIHNGHIAFAEAALQQGSLDAVYFMIEHTPRRKTGVTGYADRVAMVAAATEHNKKLNVLSIDQPTFSVVATLPLLQEQFAGAELHILVGSDLFSFIETWPDFSLLRGAVNFIVARRHDDTVDTAVLIDGDVVLDSPCPTITSSVVRSAVYNQQPIATLVPPLVQDYIAAQQLYC